jgi:threonylcarbamoyladenosine tRNA methylthiotransferase MtaB
MVGFPGETEEAFRRTYGLIEALPVSYLHVFPFSSRKGTLASTLSQTVSEGSKKIRADQMRRLGKENRQAFYRRFLRQRLDVLVEDQRDKKTARWKGFSRNYIPVQIVDDGHLKDPSDWINQELPVLVTELLDSAVLGRRGERQDG